MPGQAHRGQMNVQADFGNQRHVLPIPAVQLNQRRSPADQAPAPGQWHRERGENAVGPGHRDEFTVGVDRHHRACVGVDGASFGGVEGGAHRIDLDQPERCVGRDEPGINMAPCQVKPGRRCCRRRQWGIGTQDGLDPAVLHPQATAGQAGPADGVKCRSGDDKGFALGRWWHFLGGTCARCEAPGAACAGQTQQVAPTVSHAVHRASSVHSCQVEPPP